MPGEGTKNLRKRIPVVTESTNNTLLKKSLCHLHSTPAGEVSLNGFRGKHSYFGKVFAINTFLFVESRHSTDKQ